MTDALDSRLIRQGADRHGLTFGGIAIFIAATVFIVDTFTDIEGAIAVLYAIALLLSAEILNRTGLIMVAAAFMAMTLISFLLTNVGDPGFPKFLRLTVSLAALAVTAALLLRNERIRSELLKSNSALRESEARYRTIFDRTRVALWERDYSKLREYLMALKSGGVVDMKAHARVDPDFVAKCIDMIKVVDANEAAVELLGTSASRRPGTVMKRWIPVNSESFIDVLQAIVDGASYFEGNAEVFADNGEARNTLVGISFPKDPMAFNRVVVSMVDITQREEARKALSDAQAELSRASKAATVGALSASLAHELNQPLGAIGVNAQTLVRWLDKSPPDIEAAKRSAERILRDSNRASDIFKSTRAMMLAPSKDAEPFGLEDVVTDTLALMELDLQREGASVEVVKKTEVPVLVGGRVEMQQVLINLISNAAQAMSAASSKERLVSITLDASADADYVSIAIRDTGNGLSDEARQKLFKPFFTTKETGMGIGLSICRSTIEARGGTLDGANHPEGGAIFEIRLPKERTDA